MWFGLAESRAAWIARRLDQPSQCRVWTTDALTGQMILPELKSKIRRDRNWSINLEQTFGYSWVQLGKMSETCGQDKMATNKYALKAANFPRSSAVKMDDIFALINRICRYATRDGECSPVSPQRRQPGWLHSCLREIWDWNHPERGCFELTATGHLQGSKGMQLTSLTSGKAGEIERQLNLCEIVTSSL